MKDFTLACMDFWHYEIISRVFVILRFAIVRWPLGFEPLTILDRPEVEPAKCPLCGGGPFLITTSRHHSYILCAQCGERLELDWLEGFTVRYSDDWLPIVRVGKMNIAISKDFLNREFDLNEEEVEEE